MKVRILSMALAAGLSLAGAAEAAPAKKQATVRESEGSTDPHAVLKHFEQQAFPRPLPIPTLLLTPDAAKLAAPARPPETRVSVSPSPPTPSSPPSAPPAWATRLTLPDLPVRWHDKILKYLSFYKTNRRGRAIMRTWLERMGRYAPTIERLLAKHRAPRALIYVAMIESGFDPNRTSRAGAAGLWQFMVRTGRGFGLKRSHWIDQRRDPQLATVAAIQYLLNLHRRFRSWDLALAAYNAGYGTVLRAIRKYNTNDYWRLCEYEAGLPWSTTLYVAKVLAAAIVGENPAAFGYGNVKPDPELSFELVSAPRSLTLKQIARVTGKSVEELKRLNPELRRGRTTPGRRSWVRVPKGSAERFYRRLGELGKLRYRPYAVIVGETLPEIATRLGTSTATLRRINGLRSEKDLYPGLVLLVPATKKANARLPASPQEPLLVALPSHAPSEVQDKKRVFYRVVLGDTLAEIGGRLGVSADDLARWNDIDPSARLVSEMILQAFVAADQDLSRVRLLDPRDIKVVTTGGREFLELHESRRGRRRVIYTVRKGDTLKRLSRRFKLSVGSLARINGFSRSHQLRAGEKVTLYLEDRRAPSHKRKRRLAKTTRASQKGASKRKATAPKSRTSPSGLKASQPPKPSKRSAVQSKSPRRTTKAAAAAKRPPPAKAPRRPTKAAAAAKRPPPAKAPRKDGRPAASSRKIGKKAPKKAKLPVKKRSAP